MRPRIVVAEEQLGSCPSEETTPFVRGRLCALTRVPPEAYIALTEKAQNRQWTTPEKDRNVEGLSGQDCTQTRLHR